MASALTQVNAWKKQLRILELVPVYPLEVTAREIASSLSMPSQEVILAIKRMSSQVLLAEDLRPATPDGTTYYTFASIEDKQSSLHQLNCKIDGEDPGTNKYWIYLFRSYSS